MSGRERQDDVERPAPPGPRRLRFGDLVVDVAARELARDGRPIHLTPLAFDLLLRFLERPGEVLTRRELLAAVWEGRFVEDASLTQTVFLLRKALAEDDPAAWIRTEPGRGYRFVGEVTAVDEPPAAMADGATATAPARRRWRGAALAALALALAAAAVAVWRPSSPGGGVGDVATVAVLPFVDGATGEPTPLGIGLADAAAEALALRRGLVVRPLGTVLEHVRAGGSPVEIGARLGADAVVTGTIGAAGDDVRVAVHVLGSDGATVWEDVLAGPRADLFVLQDRVASGVAAAVDPGGPRRADAAPRDRGTESFAAYEWLMDGRYHLASRNPDRLLQARESFGSALAVDPAYADAWADLAVTEFLLGTYSVGELSARERCRRSREAAERALRHRPGLAAVETLLGTLELHCHHDLARAEGHFRRGLRLAPDSPRAHHWFAWYLFSTGRRREGRAELERALELDPMSLIVRSAWSGALAYSGEPRRALEVLDGILAVDPDFGRAHLNRGAVLEELGRLAEAEAALERAQRLMPGSPEVDGALARVRVLAGAAPPSAAELARLPPLQQALVHAAIGDHDAGLDALATAVDRREVWLWVLRYDPRLEPLRRHPAFDRVEEKVGVELGGHPPDGG